MFYSLYKSKTKPGNEFGLTFFIMLYFSNTVTVNFLGHSTSSQPQPDA